MTNRDRLASGAAAQLIVDAPRFVTFGGDDVEAADGHYVRALRRPLLA